VDLSQWLVLFTLNCAIDVSYYRDIIITYLLQIYNIHYLYSLCGTVNWLEKKNKIITTSYLIIK